MTKKKSSPKKSAAKKPAAKKTAAKKTAPKKEAPKKGKEIKQGDVLYQGKDWTKAHAAKQKLIEAGFEHNCVCVGEEWTTTAGRFVGR